MKKTIHVGIYAGLAALLFKLFCERRNHFDMDVLHFWSHTWKILIWIAIVTIIALCWEKKYL